MIDSVQDTITIRSDYEFIHIPVLSILYVESFKGQVVIHTSRQKIVTSTSFRRILTQLPEHIYVRTSRDHVVAVTQIYSIEPRRINLLNKESIPLSKGYRDRLIQLLTKMGMIDKKD